MSEAIEGWHFLTDEGRTGQGNLLVYPGQVLRVEGEIVPCANGLHASRKALDALQYAPGATVQRVVVRGDIREEGDKFAGRERECLWTADASRVLHEFAIWCAEEALKTTGDADPRSLKALEVKRLWLEGKATDEELDAARAAARDAQNERLESMLMALGKEIVDAQAAE